MPPIKRKSYTKEALEKAVNAVKNGMPLRAASQQYNVPRSTIFIKSQGKISLHATMGPSTYLSKEEEEKLCDWILYIGQRGFPITKTKLLDSVQSLVIELGRETPFINNRPGRHWFEAFLRRHPQLSKRLAQTLTSSRASVSEIALRSWFREVQQHLLALNLVLIDSSRVFNCDESAFRLCPELGHVIVKKGAKSVYNVASGDEKECVTVLFMVNAAGTMVPPMVLHGYKRVPYNVSNKMPKDWSMGISEKGWMTAETFYEYVTNIFYPWLVKNNISFPVVLYVDGHSSHVTMPLVKFCKSVQIELIALYPNATHIIQPLDVSVFHPMKHMWRQCVTNWRLGNQGERLRKEDFAPLLKNTIDSLHNLENTIQNGFRACGLWPFSADAVNFNILDKNKKPDVEIITLDSSTSDQNECSISYKEHLNCFEKNIDDTVLTNFKLAEATGVWTGAAEFKQLFLFWLKIKGKCDNNVNNNNKGVDNNVLQTWDSNVESGDCIIINLDEDQGSNLNKDIDLQGTNNDVNVLNITTLECNLIDGIIVDRKFEDCNSDAILVRQNPTSKDFEVSEQFETASELPTQSSFQERILDKENLLRNEMPLPFQKTLFWPKPIERKRQGKCREKIPTVATSEEWQQYFSHKEEQKLQKQKELEERKQNKIEARGRKLKEQELRKHIKKEKLEESTRQKLAAKEAKLKAKNKA